jgi:hypothetical protein
MQRYESSPKSNMLQPVLRYLHLEWHVSLLLSTLHTLALHTVPLGNLPRAGTVHTPPPTGSTRSTLSRQRPPQMRGTGHRHGQRRRAIHLLPRRHTGAGFLFSNGLLDGATARSQFFEATLSGGEPRCLKHILIIRLYTQRVSRGCLRHAGRQSAACRHSPHAPPNREHALHLVTPEAPTDALHWVSTWPEAPRHSPPPAAAHRRRVSLLQRLVRRRNGALAIL